MERIFSGNVLAPTSISEYIEFSKDRPYTISIKSFNEDDIAIPHYASSFEIILCDNLIGEVIMDTTHYTLGGQQVFVIPPEFVHSTIVQKCSGKMYVLKISLVYLSYFINIENILSYIDLSMNTKICSQDLYSKLFIIVEQLIDRDEDIFMRISGILSVFQVLAPHFADNQQEGIKNNKKSQSQLKKLIDWSEEQLGNNITIEDAASFIGYSKYYFCHWFKDISGITYNEYLKQIRINKACKLLLENNSVSEVSHLCGYENTSYFIRLFSYYRKCTPREYSQKYKT